MSVKSNRSVLALVALLAAVPLLASCSSANKALSCGKTAVSVAGDVQDLTDSATNVGQLTDESRRQKTVQALKKLDEDAGKLRKPGSKADLKKVADDLSKAVGNAQKSVADGTTPDLGPIASAAGDLTKTCASAST
ncbi:hypothetical protein [Kitasatospora sp. MAP5-34]|uniref:hypothetical protein n=1 Tax=Kitasatospora sp. MAP5-34 TaxID=3035102 RepID=UPI0024768E50|nr:hypothetical protein [Kitasatospora sp. MAP5-34]MDH6579818.1 putative lipoprotein YajG [Kitasatospora sp. MAP5-34]